MPVIVERPAKLRHDEKQRNLLWERAFWEKGEGWVRVVSSSMTPLIKEGERVLVLPVEVPQARRGDVLLFRQGDELVIHRMLAKRDLGQETSILQQGDQGGEALWIPWRSVIGQVVAVEKRGGMVWLNSGSMALYQRILGGYLYLVFCLEREIKSLKGPLRKIPGMRLLKPLGPNIFRALSHLRLIPLLLFDLLSFSKVKDTSPFSVPPHPASTSLSMVSASNHSLSPDGGEDKGEGASKNEAG